MSAAASQALSRLVIAVKEDWEAAKDLELQAAEKEEEIAAGAAQVESKTQELSDTDDNQAHSKQDIKETKNSNEDIKETQKANGYKEVKWLWEDHGWWKFYDDVQIQQLEEAFQNDDAEVVLKTENGNFTINFESMTQLGQRQRPVQRVAIL